MKVKYTLTTDEVKNILATHFGVDIQDVNLKIAETYVGYGTNERKDHILECSIDIERGFDDYRLHGE